MLKLVSLVHRISSWRHHHEQYKNWWFSRRKQNLWLEFSHFRKRSREGKNWIYRSLQQYLAKAHNCFSLHCWTLILWNLLCFCYLRTRLWTLQDTYQPTYWIPLQSSKYSVFQITQSRCPPITLFTTVTETSQKSSKWSHSSIYHNECIVGDCIRLL